ncbi:glycosyltransferase family 4 protein [Thalassotalea mangrovi]|uniref:Glycosyltransferase family 4 protein n=1 Tax=Thalassotalea mangrovi TaxID=2572245 RepID=A0A4U1B995_9GAMM|nr:glycosyltransferase family 4 protein [Thalassotalea mangrovi]TKB46631.1 glycosyltransferase family 4 protein [Thalassotalea mangrovi]
MSKLLIITNLYPSSWDPNRATFNKQQFDRLADFFDVSILVPVAWTKWLKLSQNEKREGGENLRYQPFFYTPKFPYAMFSVYMFVSLFTASWRWIKALRPKALLASWAYPEGVATALLAKYLSCPFFIKVHGSDINEFGKDKWRAKQITWAANRAAAVFVVSDALRQRMISLGVDEQKLHLVYNGVDKKLFFPAAASHPRTSKRLLYVGNLKANKGVIELISSFTELLHQFPDSKLVIAGQGEMESAMRQMLDDRLAADKVEFLGSIAHQQVAQEIRLSDVVVLPSYAEGVPNILLEAMACGKPVVATSVGGIPEIVTEKTGILVPAKMVKPLTQAMIHALTKTWSEREIVNHAAIFDWHHNIRLVHKVIEQVIEQHSDNSVVSI